MPQFEILPATSERWGDLVAVMQSCSAGRNCWCAYWYLPNADYRAGWGDRNRQTLDRLVKHGEEPGLIAYADDEPAAWVGVAPRGNFDRLNRSKNFAPLDDRDVWAVNCFIVAPKFHRHGLMPKLARAAADFAIGNGAAGAEGYPIVPGPKTSAADLYLGTERAFIEAGYKEVARPLLRRPIMRRMR